MNDEWMVAIDQGTTNTKALLVGRDGRPHFRTCVPVSLRSPRDGWIEQDALELWRSVVHALGDCVAWVTDRSDRIAGIAISNQRETVVGWDRSSSRPIAPAISWQCQRTTSICDRLKAAGNEPMLRERSGLGVDPLFSATKMEWMLENVPSLRQRALAGEICFGNVDSWLVWMLTRGSTHVCDVSNASRTQLLNLHTATWDPELLNLFQIPRAVLPEVKPSSGEIGSCSAIESLHNVPIVSAIGDSHAALFGHRCFSVGSVKATYGTGSSLMTLLPGPPTADGTSKLASTVAWDLPPSGAQYALEGNIFMTGAAVQWVGEFLGLPDPVNDTAALARTVTDCEGLYFVPAMLGLGAPHWDHAARGTITGLGRSSRAPHFVLAAVQSIAFQIRDVFDAMQQETSAELCVLHADGGATRNDALMQFQADILGRPVLRAVNEDLSAIGAAWLGGLALGWWQSLGELQGIQGDSTTFYPKMPAEQRDSRYAGWKHAVEQARLQAGQS